MIVHERHLSSFELDLHFARHEPNADIEGHVAACERCRAYLEELASLRENEAAARYVGFDVPPPEAPSLPGSRRPRRARWAPFAALSLTAALAASIYVLESRVDAPAYVAVKGSPGVQILVRTGGETRPWNGQNPVRAGDALALRVVCEDFARVSVVTLEAGSQRLHRLSESDCPHDAPSILPFTLVVDDEPGPERFSVVLSRTPLDDRAMRSALEASTRNGSIWVTTFDLDKEVR
jgi:hypothetical protein